MATSSCPCVCCLLPPNSCTPLPPLLLLEQALQAGGDDGGGGRFGGTRRVGGRAAKGLHGWCRDCLGASVVWMARLKGCARAETLRGALS